jgi:hypothetical protein
MHPLAAEGLCTVVEARQDFCASLAGQAGAFDYSFLVVAQREGRSKKAKVKKGRNRFLPAVFPFLPFYFSL